MSINQHYIMNRRGTFKTMPTPNQCKETGHVEYHYHIKMVFDADTKLLDENTFIIDHFDIDKAVQNAMAHGSCEVMQHQIYKSVKTILTEHGRSILGYCCRVSPVIPNLEPSQLSAFLDFVRVKNPIAYQLLAL